MAEFTQGICADGAAILKDGVMLTVEEIIELLRQGDALMGRGEAHMMKIAKAKEICESYAFEDGSNPVDFCFPLYGEFEG